MEGEAFRCTMECNDYLYPEREPESTFGLTGKSDGKTCAAIGCNKKKAERSKYCAFHRAHRPRSEAAYRRMVER
jgi:hypothetical protein